MEDWELVLEASLNPNLEDNEATASLQKKVKEGRMAARTAERRQKCEEEEQRVWAEAEQKVQEEAEQRAWEEAEQKKEEEEKAWRAEEAKQRAEEVMRAAEAQRRTAEGQCKLSVVIPMGGALVVHLQGPGLHATGVQIGDPHSGVKVSCSWLKAAGGVTWKWRRMEAKEDDGEDNKGDDEDDSKGDFAVLPALVTLLKEFKGYCCEQWDLHTCQVKGLKALQREMRKANALKAKELEVTTKGKEKMMEVTEESSESGDEEEQAKGEGSEDGDGDRDVKMGAGPLASAM
ncbi:hypothetical protein ID866_11732 [Astraeus odoratus]|nr:hypothetical protein ID866_11732 [Astraeus odoratus]